MNTEKKKSWEKNVLGFRPVHLQVSANVNLHSSGNPYAKEIFGFETWSLEEANEEIWFPSKR